MNGRHTGCRKGTGIHRGLHKASVSAGIGEGTLSYDIFTINILIYIDARKKSVIMKLVAANLFSRYKENRRDRRGTDHTRCGLDNMGLHTVLTGDSL